MSIQSIAMVVIISWSISACVSNNSVSMEELETQNKADAVVSGALFDHELDTTASYNIRKNGTVIIKFDESVSSQNYTKVVKSLRSNPDIKAVRAEQGGIEVCPVLH